MGVERVRVGVGDGRENDNMDFSVVLILYNLQYFLSIP